MEVLVISKHDIIKKFQKNPDQYWGVKLFGEEGFVRRKCTHCGKFFWTLTEDTVCNDVTCRPYGFIGNPPTKRKFDYFETWNAIEKFFAKRGHAPLKAYPVVNRWFPGLYFTIAGIVNFYRKEEDELVFEFPANPNILLQPCLRFNDVQNTGLNGKSYSCFEMIQQSALYNAKEGYWKDTCVALDYELLTAVFGIPPEEIMFIEDAWLGPNAFGSSLEYYVQGLELGNCVFTEFVGTPTSYTEMKNKVIDMGAGFERFVWISNGTPTSYDVVFGPVINTLFKQTGLEYDNDFMAGYAKLSGTLNIDEIADLNAERKRIAAALSIPLHELEQKVSPVEGLYALADHTRTLLFAISDGGLPSNVAGGYNLRVILRRALSIIEKFNWDVDLGELAALHAKYLKKRYPILKEHIDTVQDVLAVEGARYQQTREKSQKIIQSYAGKEIPEHELLQLYDSKGIPPEQLGVKVPENFYKNLTEKHMNAEREEKEHEKIPVKPAAIQQTQLLYYENPYMQEFDATVLKKTGNWVVLNKTCFYPEGGGQPGDYGMLTSKGRTYEVIDTQKADGIILHKLKSVTGIREGEHVHGKLNWERRSILMKMHDATHIIAGAARAVIGTHIWQAGAQKGTDTSRLDVTHYLPFTHEAVEKIEELANKIVKKNLPITAKVYPRGEAERTFGFTLYQGGSSPGKEVRVLNVGDGFDVEACGGTHGFTTKDVELIKIIKTERIQDGVNRIEFTAGPRAREFVKEERNLFDAALEQTARLSPSLREHSQKLLEAAQKQDHRFISRALSESAAIFSVERKHILPTLTKFITEIEQGQELLNTTRQKMGKDGASLEEETFFSEVKHMDTLPKLCQLIFTLWKQQRKSIDKMRHIQSEKEARSLIEKAREGEVFEIVDGERKDLIETATIILSLNPDLTVILANQAGDIIGMSRKKDMGPVIAHICRETGGSGGGRGGLAQGRVNLSKLLRYIEKHKK